MSLEKIIKSGVLAASMGLAGLVIGQTVGQYAAQQSAGQTAQQKPVVALGNCDTDDLADMILLEASGIPMYFVNNNGYFSEDPNVVLQVPKNFRFVDVALADCNGDGLADMVLLGSSGVPRYFANNNGYFSEDPNVVLQMVQSLK